MMTKIGIRLVLLIAIGATIGCDRVTKHVAATMLSEAPRRSFLADTFRLEYVENTGAFLGLGDEGVEVFSPKGESLGIIPIPRGTTTLAFAGPDKKTLFVIGRGNEKNGGGDGRSMYKIAMLAQGYKGRAK